MVEMPKDFSLDHAEPASEVHTFTGNRGLAVEEPLIFEIGLPEISGVDFDEPEETETRLGGVERSEPIGLPGLSEPQAIRHYVRLSQKNYSIDTGIFPLGSCTMKHNPRLNEKMARLPGFGDIHPLQPEKTVQGALDLMTELSRWLVELTGMQAVALSPKAGAHGEMCGMMAIRAAIEARGKSATRRKVLVPESAHGTNPATAALLGFTVRAVEAREDGTVSAEAVRARLGPDVAAMMLTNPNTCGLFEPEIAEIAAALHEAGAYLYCDGANFNAIAGKVRPGDLGVDAMHINLHKTFSTPHGGGGPGAGPVVLSEALAPFAPLPFVRKDGDDYRLVEHAGDAQEAASPVRKADCVSRTNGHVRARARLHDEPRRGRHPAGVRGRRVERELCARLPERCSVRSFRRPRVHARSAVRRPLPEGHARLDARLRESADRRGLPSDDGLFPACRFGRDARGTDRVRNRSRASISSLGR